MGKRRKVVATVLVGLAFVALVAYRRHPAEPSYDGHPLSYWVVALANADHYDRATNAIDHIGVASLPFLVNWVQIERPPRWRFLLGDWLSRAHLPLADKLAELTVRTRRRELALGTQSAFQLLGERATPAIPELTKLAMVTTNAFGTSAGAMSALVHIGRPAVPSFAALLQQPSNVHNRWLWSTIWALGTNAAPLIPLMAPDLRHPDPFVAITAAKTLARLRLAPEVTVPALTNCLADPRPDVRACAVDALRIFGDPAALPALTNSLTDAVQSVRSRCTNAIQELTGTSRAFE